jgi:hypothetical protein
MFLTLQQLVNDVPTGLQRQVRFQQGGTLMQTDYEKLGHGEIRRALSNKALALSNDNIKFGLGVSGSGWQSPGLDDMNWVLPVRMGCLLPLCQQSNGGAITPMRTAREDVGPYAMAIMANRGPVQTTLTDWTPAAVTGALYYLVYFYPVLDGYARFSGGLDQASGEFRWTLDFQEK